MAAVDVKEEWSGVEGEAETRDGKRGTQAYRRSFTVTVDDPANDGETTVLLATGIPRLRDSHPRNLGLRVNRLRANALGPTLYRVAVDYDAPIHDPAETSPLNEPAKIRFFGVQTTEKIDEDIDGAPIVNPLGERYEPQEMDWSDLGLSVTRNVPTFDPFQIAAYQNAVNSDNFLGLPAGTCKMMRFDVENVADKDFEYWVKSAEIHIRRGIRTTDERAWWLRIRCEGLYEFINPIGADWLTIRAEDSTGESVSQPVLLYARTEGGHNKGERIPTRLPDSVEFEGPPLAEWQEFQIYKTLPFNALNLL